MTRRKKPAAAVAAAAAGAAEGTELAARGTPARGPNAATADRRPSRDRASWSVAQRILKATNAIARPLPSPQLAPPPASSGGATGQGQTAVRV